MPPPTLPTRPWPQTLLLTILTLLIAAATIMLACGPVAPPIPEEGDTFTAAPQVEGGSEEPEEEPTATPTVEPTATPTPYPTQCIVMPRDLQHLEEAEFKDGQIRRVRRDGLLLQCEVVTPAPPTPTPKYPQLGEQLSRYAVEAEEIQSDATQSEGASGSSGAEIPGGTTGNSGTEIPLVYLHVVLSANTEEVVAWLQSNGLPLSEDWVEGDRGYIGAYRVDWELGDDFIYALVPASLLVALSQQEGVTYIEDVGYLLDHIEND